MAALSSNSPVSRRAKTSPSFTWSLQVTATSATVASAPKVRLASSPKLTLPVATTMLLSVSCMTSKT